jgi:hypothetical protein
MSLLLLLRNSEPATAGAIAEPTREYTIWREIVIALEETNEFATVIVGERPTKGRSQFGADDTPAAVLTPISFNESDEWDDEDDVSGVRESTAYLTLIVREDEERKRFDLLDRLGSVACAALNGQSFDDAMIGGRTRVSGGKFLDPRDPEKHLELMLRFSYFVPGYGGYLNAEYTE